MANFEQGKFTGGRSKELKPKLAKLRNPEDVKREIFIREQLNYQRTGLTNGKDERNNTGN